MNRDSTAAPLSTEARETTGDLETTDSTSPKTMPMMITVRLSFSGLNESLIRLGMAWSTLDELVHMISHTKSGMMNAKKL